MVGFASDGVIVYMRLKISVGMGMKMGVIESLLSVTGPWLRLPDHRLGVMALIRNSSTLEVEDRMSKVTFHYTASVSPAGDS